MNNAEGEKEISITHATYTKEIPCDIVCFDYMERMANIINKNGVEWNWF